MGRLEQRPGLYVSTVVKNNKITSNTQTPFSKGVFLMPFCKVGERIGGRRNWFIKSKSRDGRS